MTPDLLLLVSLGPWAAWAAWRAWAAWAASAAWVAWAAWAARANVAEAVTQEPQANHNAQRGAAACAKHAEFW